MKLARLNKRLASTAILFLAVAPGAVAQGDFTLDLDFAPSAPETIRPPEVPDSIALTAPAYMNRDWMHLLRHRALNVKDTTVVWPNRFVDFVIRAYNWVDHTFNSFDPGYVSHTKSGQVRIVYDNWSDLQNFQPVNTMRLVVGSNMYPSIGLNVSYSIFSIGYTVDLPTLFSPITSSSHKKTEFGINWSRINAQIHLWDNQGDSRVRGVGKFSGIGSINEPYDGMKFRAYNLKAYYIFNHQRYSHSAAYNSSRIQKRSAGSWLAGINYYRYNVLFDLDALPESVKALQTYPWSRYHIKYNTYNVMGGYAFNWVLAKGLLFNSTILPGAGLTHTHTESSQGSELLAAFCGEVKVSLSYNYKRLFMNLTASANGNIFLSDNLVFASGIFSTRASFGLRF